MSIKVAGFDVPVVSTVSPGDEAGGHYDPYNPSKTILRKGHQRSPQNRTFPVDAIFEKDTALPMRDGVKLVCDIFRPVTDQKLPALLIWSPYGKTGNGPHSLGMIPGRFGIPEDSLSGYEKFEGLDPAVWVARGYAIVNVDLRGSWDSEGIAPWLGEQDGKDGYDAVEYVSQLDWCSGKVGMAGNSWLAMSQWFIAAQKPPHLAAFAPWEGASDFYRDTLNRGGVPYPYDSMWGLLEQTTVGRNGAESIIQMLEKYPEYNGYWEDKRAKLDLITAPVYVLASYSSALHTTGSLRGFRDISSKEKWLRIHPSQEWADLYSPESQDDLQRFFDYYLKGDRNGWQTTPQIRTSILQFNKASHQPLLLPPIANLVVPSYPLPQTTNTTLYLQSNGQLASSQDQQQQTSSYRTDIAPNLLEAAAEEVKFTHTFARPTWLTGYSWLVLHVSSDQEDADVFAQIRKLDASGKLLVNENVPAKDLIPPAKDASEMAESCFLQYFGPNGIMRASHAVSKLTGPNTWPEYSHETRQPVPAGTVVRLEIPIWPTGMAFDAGESLVVLVSGHYMSFMEFPFLNGASHKNKGRQTIYFGGKYDSHLVVPLMDPLDA